MLCPQCADKLTEIAMVHMMVKDSNSFFNRLPPGSQEYSSPSRALTPDFIPLEQSSPYYVPKSPSYIPIEQNSPYYVPMSPSYTPISPCFTPNNPQLIQEFPNSRIRNLSSNSFSKNHNKPVVILSSEDEASDDEGKKNSFMRNGRRVFPCKLCKKEFTRGVHRRKHYIDVHPELNRLQCPVCNESKRF